MRSGLALEEVGCRLSQAYPVPAGEDLPAPATLAGAKRDLHAGALRLLQVEDRVPAVLGQELASATGLAHLVHEANHPDAAPHGLETCFRS